MGRQWNTIIESLGPLSGGTMSINANLTEIEALLTTLQADVADGIIVTSGTGVITGGTITAGTVTSNAGTGSFTVSQGTAANLKGQAQILNSAGSVVSPAEVGTAGSPSIDVLSVQGISGGTPVPIRPRNGAATVTNGSTSSTANTNSTALSSSTSRQYLLMQNISDTDMYISFGTTASTSNSLLLAKNGSGIVFESGFVPTDAVNVICSGTSKPFYILSA
jgi:hypothetical protein